MRKLFVAAVLGALGVSAFAQGQVNFANYVPTAGINAPIYSPGWSPNFPPPPFAVDIYWGSAGTTDSTLLTPLGKPANSLTGFGSGYFFIGGVRTLPVPAGTTIVVQLRAWTPSAGNDWLTVLNSALPYAQVGESGLFSVTLQPAPVNLVGLQPFILFLVPQPPPPPLLLTITSTATNTLLLSWPYTGFYTVQQNPDLNPTNWVTLSNITNWYLGESIQVRLPKPSATVFYRLISQPASQRPDKPVRPPVVHMTPRS
jgi:hypothetical protein